MTKSELQTGMIVELRNGNTYIIMLNHCGTVKTDILAGMAEDKTITHRWASLDNYYEDLTHQNIKDLDIVRVYSTRVYQINRKKDLIWERPEVKEVTMDEVEKMFGCKVKIINDKEGTT